MLFKRSHTGCGMMLVIFGGEIGALVGAPSPCSSGIRVARGAGVDRSHETREEWRLSQSNSSKSGCGNAIPAICQYHAELASKVAARFSRKS